MVRVKPNTVPVCSQSVGLRSRHTPIETQTHAPHWLSSVLFGSILSFPVGTPPFLTWLLRHPKSPKTILPDSLHSSSPLRISAILLLLFFYFIICFIYFLVYTQLVYINFFSNQGYFFNRIQVFGLRYGYQFYLWYTNKVSSWIYKQRRGEKKKRKRIFVVKTKLYFFFLFNMQIKILFLLFKTTNE